MWAEAEIERGAIVSDAAPDVGFAFRPDSIPGPARLHANGTAGAPLAGATVAD
jgi:hypothetical protein